MQPVQANFRFLRNVLLILNIRNLSKLVLDMGHMHTTQANIH